jgi:Fe-S cluster assembly iron-binding protein IscA
MFSMRQKLSDIMRRDNNPDLSLRIEVQSGGCHGFQYLMSLQPHQDSSSVTAEDDSDVQDVVFRYFEDNVEPDLEAKAPTLVLDEASLELLKGSKVDFTMELIGSQFKIVDNPYATSSCGCGTSFDIKP